VQKLRTDRWDHPNKKLTVKGLSPKYKKDVKRLYDPREIRPREKNARIIRLGPYRSLK
jgi:hypothetical protein